MRELARPASSKDAERPADHPPAGPEDVDRDERRERGVEDRHVEGEASRMPATTPTEVTTSASR